ncbi:MAG: rRNA pseudouridine synthase, partial [Acidobacteria bacterium]|nr:rRNA pseudouridine synthase [Acidobacteriota bacterium]
MAPVERLQKIIARAGIASRRAAEQLMRERRVTVNGVVADKPGAQADPETDHIRVDGKLLRPTSAARTYLAAFKPREMLTTLEDPEGRPTVRNLLHAARIRSRVFPVGRLDWDADGLLLLTDDGDWAQRIAHPRHHLGKVYRVKVRGTPSEPELERLRRGIFIEAGVRTAPALVEIEKAGEPTSWVRVTLFEGRHNQIKRMFERIGHPVRRLRRVAIGPIGLGRMRVGEVRALTMEELALIARALRGERATRASGSRARPAG